MAASGRSRRFINLPGITELVGTEVHSLAINLIYSTSLRIYTVFVISFAGDLAFSGGKAPPP
jgi:hypothetical protein